MKRHPLCKLFESKIYRNKNILGLKNETICYITPSKFSFEGIRLIEKDYIGSLEKYKHKINIIENSIDSKTITDQLVGRCFLIKFRVLGKIYSKC